jgi:hypothetical protein
LQLSYYVMTEPRRVEEARQIGNYSDSIKVVAAKA